MKFAELSLLTVLSTVCDVLPQGQITFGNNLPGLKAPIFGPELDWVNYGGDWANAKTGNTPSNWPAGTQTYNGSPLESFIVSFWAAPGVVADGRLLLPSASTATLGTGSLAGYFPTITATFAGLPKNGSVTVQVRVHDPNRLWNFGEIIGDGFNPYGSVAATSALFTANIGSTATGLRSFSVGWLDPATLAPYVPEPNSFTLLLLGGAALLRQSRKRKS